MRALSIFFTIVSFFLLKGSVIASAQLVTSNHSLSAEIVGIEYTYEYAVGGNWSVLFRAGAPCAPIVWEETPVGSTEEWHMSIAWGPLPGITIEPRVYTNIQRRANKGKEVDNNSANFFSIKIQSNYGIWFPEFIPAYGIRRSEDGHWFEEYTFGAVYYTAHNRFLPHLEFRIGYSF